MEELMNSYEELQKRIFDVIEENKYSQNDEVVNTLDLLEQAEEDFDCILTDYLLRLSEVEGLREV